ncbi:hypothetical protein JCM16303_001104 [Sporobolomyces ruberrimus]
MSPAIVRRAIVRRNVVEDWGTNLQTWVQERPPAAVFAMAIAFAFFSALILLSLVWETIRKCRSSYRASGDRERAEWIQLPDGSSVLTQGRVPNVREQRRGNYTPGAYLGPMSSLIRDARQGGGGGQQDTEQARYVPAQTGTTSEMVADSQMVAGLYAPYDPPLAHANFTRQSTGSTSRWSEQTRVDSAVEVEEKKDKASLDLPQDRPAPPVTNTSTVSMTPVVSAHPIPSIPAPPRPSPAPTPSNSNPSGPKLPVSSPLVRPVELGHTRQASSGGFQPKGLHLVNHTSPGGSPGVVVGEDRFSTPKSTPTPVSTSLPPATRHSTLSSSSGWSAPTLAASPAPSDKTFKSSTSIFPPRVDLKRTGTWSSSLSSWIPGLSASDKAEEEERMKLVEKALKDSR